MRLESGQADRYHSFEGSNQIRGSSMIAAPSETRLLGVGLYTPAEAALYARIPTQTLTRWLFADRGKNVIEPQLEGERLVSFLDFVSAMAIRQIRLARKGVSLQKIREAVRTAEEEYGLPYPLARSHTTFLFGSDVAINVGSQESRRYVQLSGKHKHNRLLTEVAELYLESVSWDAEGLAKKYDAFHWAGFSITMDPAIRFGEPLVEGCRYSAQALWDAYVAEGGIEPAAKAFGVEANAIRAACQYYDFLQPPASAAA